MRKLVVSEHMSLDGVIQAPGGPEEDPGQGFRLGGWTAPYAHEAIGNAVRDLLAEPFELLLGRRTYDIWATYWPNVRVGNTIGDLLNRVPKHVATHRPDTLDWQNSRGLEGELPGCISALRRQNGDRLLTWGSANLVQQLLAGGLVDELFLIIYPVVLGQGKRLFREDAQPSAFSLAHEFTTPGDVILTRYFRSGPVRTGAFVE